MYTDKWGLLQQINFVIRTRTEFVSVQILFPISDEGGATDSMPLEVANFDKTVNINAK